MTYVTDEVEMEAPVALRAAVAEVLELLGYDVADQHFQGTPTRMAQVLWEYRKNGNIGEVAKLLDVKFDDEYESLVMVGPISVTALCSHHVLPWVGSAWVGYLPDGKICGLSKLARIVEFYARQLTLQERVTQEVANALDVHLEPKGVMVVIKAAHGCMSMRGVEEPEAETVTSAIRGVFLTEPSARSEFLSLMEMRH